MNDRTSEPDDQIVLDLVQSSLRVVAKVFRQEQEGQSGRHREELAQAVRLIAEGLAVLLQSYQRAVAHKGAQRDGQPPQNARSGRPR